MGRMKSSLLVMAGLTRQDAAQHGKNSCCVVDFLL